MIERPYKSSQIDITVESSTTTSTEKTSVAKLNNSTFSNLTRWIEPSQPNPNQPISKTNWQFDYLEIETLFLESKYNSNSLLSFDSDTLDLIKKASTYLPETLSPENLQRLAFLIQKSLPKESGVHLANLTVMYFHYSLSYRKALKEVNLAKGTHQLELLKGIQEKVKELQKQYFIGYDHRSLFHKENRFFDYLTQRRILVKDTKLTDSERRQKLTILETQFKASKSS